MYEAVQVLDEIIAFILAGPVMCCGFRRKIILMMHDNLAVAELCSHIAKDFVASHWYCPASGKAGRAPGAGRAQSQHS